MPRWNGFYWVLPGFTGFYRVLPGFTSHLSSSEAVNILSPALGATPAATGCWSPPFNNSCPSGASHFHSLPLFFSCCCLSSFLFVFFLVCLLFCSLSLSLSLVALFYCPVRSSSLLSSDLRFLFAPPSLFYRVFTEFSFVDFVFVSCSTKLVEPPRVLAACVGWKQVLPSFYRVFFRAARIIL